MLPHALIVAGPTASGKSTLALAIADALHGTVINTDSMQVYRGLRILTAQPAAEDQAAVPHRLYGVRSAAEPGNVAWWRQAALNAMAEAQATNRLPILTGGTGLYFSALVDGLIDMPDPGAPARAEARARLAEHGPGALHAALGKVDPATAARLRPTDSQRLARAWEVWTGTGRGLVAWQQHRRVPAPWRFTAILLDPPRADLRDAIAVRFQSMLRQGAVDEVRALLDLALDPALPSMKAHGVPELAAYCRDEIDLAEASQRTEQVTNRYTKRQATWFRHHPLAAQTRVRTIHSRISDATKFMERECDDLLIFCQGAS